MEKFLRPDRFDGDSSISATGPEWVHWKRTFLNFIEAQAASTCKEPAPGLSDETRLQLLINHISPRVYQSISDCTTYEEALKALDAQFVKPKNEITARHLLATRRQHPGETIDTYLQALKQLARECNFKSVDAETNTKDNIKGALHSIRSLLCTSTNCTPHERMFKHSRRSPNGGTIPTWLSSAGQVLVKRCVRANKYLPLVEEADVVEVNPDYSIVRLSDGRETAVSNRHLAPIGEEGERIRDDQPEQSIDNNNSEVQRDDQPEQSIINNNSEIQTESSTSFNTPETTLCDLESSPPSQPKPGPSHDAETPATETPNAPPTGTPSSGSPVLQREVPLRRSCRTRRPPQYLRDFSL